MQSSDAFQDLCFQMRNTSAPGTDASELEPVWLCCSKLYDPDWLVTTIVLPLGTCLMDFYALNLHMSKQKYQEHVYEHLQSELESYRFLTHMSFAAYAYTPARLTV
jgi:hypothetical protein